MIDNMMTHVKVNNEIDLCEIKSEKARKKVETAMQYAQISYYLRWQEPGFLEKLLFHKSTKVVMCVNRAQLEFAIEALADLELTDKEIVFLGESARKREK